MPAARDTSYLSFSEVGMSFPDGNSAKHILSGITLDVRHGETVCLLGASGSGKSTLLNIAAGFLTPTTGTALAEGRAIDGPAADRVMVFQEDATFPWYTVAQNVAYGLRARGTDRRDREARVAEMVELVGLGDAAGSYPRQLSGGMRKRCDMARALAVEPEAILMDEPFAALDVMTKERLQVQFRRIGLDRGLTSLFVTHDLEEALFVGDRVAVLRKGPGPLLALVDVPFPRDRDVSVKTTPEFQQLRRRLGEYIANNHGGPS
ncbi:ABC transporter ATP-binding protein [Amycolatopsis endophytica]